VGPCSANGWAARASCGDDLFVTNNTRCSRGIEEGSPSRFLIKCEPDRSLTRKPCKRSTLAGSGLHQPMISPRSGEPKTPTIADLGRSHPAGPIKTWLPQPQRERRWRNTTGLLPSKTSFGSQRSTPGAEERGHGEGLRCRSESFANSMNGSESDRSFQPPHPTLSPRLAGTLPPGYPNRSTIGRHAPGPGGGSDAGADWRLAGRFSSGGRQNRLLPLHFEG